MWNKRKIIECILNIKNQNKSVSPSCLRKENNPLLQAMSRHFGSYCEAIINAGLDPEKEAVMPNLLGNKNFNKGHSEKTKIKISQKKKEWVKLHPGYQDGKNNHMFWKKQSDKSNEKRTKTLLKYHEQFDKRPYNLTAEGRLKMQEIAAIRISKQVSQDTNIEIKMKQILKKINVEYTFQYPFKYFCVDFYLKKYNLVIWCDGDYWHSNPKIYTKLSSRQKTQSRLDNSQNSYLKNRKINFIRFWESEILKNSNECTNKINKLIKEIKSG